MAGDRLSELLDLVEVSAVASGGFAVRGPWFTRGAVHIPLKIIALVHGRARLLTDGIEAPVLLGPGDVAVLNDRSWLELAGGEGDAVPREIWPEDEFSSASMRAADHRIDDIVIGGRIDMSPAGRSLLLTASEPVTHLRSVADTAPLYDVLRRVLDEVTGQRAGSEFAIRQHGQLLLLEVLRAYAGRADLPPGWLSVLSDARLRPALDLIHDHPEKPWGLHDLARAAAMSRTTFAERFRKIAGVPPLTYLGQWRMLLARRSLRDNDVRISALAFELGYASESTFSTAFKRVVGESPQQYRRRFVNV